MYRLLVYYPEKDTPHAVLTAGSGGEALAMVQAALDEHDGCERVVVMLGVVRLFSVDCKGNRHP
jgi:hypothetical protein